MDSRFQLDGEPIRFATRELEKALERHEAKLELSIAVDPSIPPQGYCRKGSLLTARDAAGAMYGLLDLKDEIEILHGTNGLKDKQASPKILNRGLKINVPLDARTPSYSDCGDSAQMNIQNMWEFSFWQGLLDRMAQNRYNVLSLWNLGPFPSMVKVPKYPEAALNDVMRGAYPAGGTSRAMGFYTDKMKKTLITIKRLSIEEKIAFWQGVMAYAKDRCIDVYLFSWNIYLYGLEDSGYGFTESPNDPHTADYYRHSVAALLETYPLLKGIGVTAGENMAAGWTEEQDVKWVRETYGRGIEDALAKEPGRKFTLIHRSHMTTVPKMLEAFSGFKGHFELSYKYAMAHMLTTEKPHFGDDFFASLPENQKTWLTLRNDDYYTYPYMDRTFINGFFKNMPHAKMAGFYLGSDGIVWGRDYQSREPALQGRYTIDKQFPLFTLCGRWGYDGYIKEETIRALVASRFPHMNAARLIVAWENASRPVPLFQNVYWHNYDFQWYPEACVSLDEPEKQLVFHDLNQLIQGCACPGTGYLSVSESGLNLRQNNPRIKFDGLYVAFQMKVYAQKALKQLPKLPPNASLAEKELLGDIRRMAHLGLYYALKLEAAIYLCAGGKVYGQKAEEAIKNAVTHYHTYSSETAKLYKPQLLSRLRGYVSPDQFDVRAENDILICQSNRIGE